MPFAYYRTLTIDQTVVDADLTNYTVNVSLTSSNFNFTRVRSDGNDIRFFANDGTTELSYEKAHFDSSAEVAEFWVKIPSVSGSVDTLFRMYYGDAALSTDGTDLANAWDANFLGVYHLNDEPTTPGVTVHATGSVSHGTTTVTPSWPGGYTATANDKALIICLTGGTSPSITAPSGWNFPFTSVSGGSGTAGSGTGPRRISILHKTLVGGESTPAVNITTTSAGSVISAFVVIIRKTGPGTLSLTGNGGSDTTDGTGFSVASGVPETRSGDLLISVIGANDAVTVSGYGLSSAGTVAAFTEIADASTTNGDIQTLASAWTTVTAGGSNTQPTITATYSAATSGPGVLIRLNAPTMMKDSGSGLDAKTFGLVTADGVTGKLAKGIQGDGTNSKYLEPPISQSIKGSAAFTISAWVRPTTATPTTRGKIYEESRGNAVATRFALSLEANSTFIFNGRPAEADSTLYTFVNPATTVTANTWYHVVGVFDSTTDEHIMWINGTKNTNTLAMPAVDNVSSLVTPKIGTRVGVATESFPGIIDEVRLSNVARSDAWSKADYHGGNGTLLTVGAESANVVADQGDLMPFFLGF